MNKFAYGHLAANVRVRCSDFSKLRVYAVYSNLPPPSLFGEHCEIFRPADMADFEENVEKMVGTTREAAATKSGGAATKRRRRLVTRPWRPVG